IKHGIKASGMPAWGPTHDDARIWAMVAFLEKLPTLSQDEYQILTARDDGDGDRHADAPAAATPTEPVAVVDAFGKALAAGDTAAALALLDPSVTILESGGAERSRDEYAAHHLGADAAFLRAATITPLARTGDAVGALAWVGSETRIAAVSKGKPVKLASTETMVLKNTPDGWRIVHIHWSSRPDTSSPETSGEKP
ncbi:MAG TPA: nuclear transport factor 2 family protein, partial [Tahibacter sp.]|nr:nuclear transport factor 2 family protein [Tahibacter sp.]